MNSIISTDKLTYRIGRHTIVSNISLNVERSAFMCLMGPNGAGKSTFLKLICGLLTPSSGSVNIMGRSAVSYKRKKLASVMAYVPQISQSDIHFTVEEYIMTGRYPYQNALSGISPNDKAVVKAVMNVTSLNTLQDRDISTLSGGERQRVMIATALAQQADILVLDEPTIYLDPKNSMDILELLAKIHAEGVTVFMVTHDVNQALLFGTDFIGLKYGELFFHESCSAELADSGKLDNLFNTSFDKVINGGRPQILPHRMAK